MLLAATRSYAAEKWSLSCDRFWQNSLKHRKTAPRWRVTIEQPLHPSARLTTMLFMDCSVFGARVIEPSPREDERGRFVRAWCHQEFAANGLAFMPVQANMGLSRKQGTIRGLHYQAAPALEAKLVRCTRGSMFDVVVDLRPTSPTYRSWCGTLLSAENARMLFLPEGCAHGCQSLQDKTEFYYLTSAIYSPNEARGARYDDPALGIDWPLPASLVSVQDRNWPLLEQLHGGVRK